MVDVKVPDPSCTGFHELFCAAAAVDKYKRFSTSNDPDKRIDPVVLLRLDNKEELFFLRGSGDMDQFRRMPPVREPVQELMRIPGSCRKTNALDLPFCQLVHAVEQHLKVHAPLRFDERVEFVNNNVPHLPEIGSQCWFL